ncbi:MAG TPA: DNA-3-methyladenine glycosylase [Gammaproteobacteria bacterium]|nr:DNA-3-methyladenine glycosylase [Gammaproteobacteria bacterium]
MIITQQFFDRDAQVVAIDLLGKVLRHHYHGMWLSAMIIETEAYYLEDKGSHASLGLTEKRKALFMPPGTIYMYYAHGGDSLNLSCRGAGNAVLIKSGIAWEDGRTHPNMLEQMRRLNPILKSGKLRPVSHLCSGQTLLCRSLTLKVPEWNQKTFDPQRFYLEDVGYHPQQIIQTTRLGIPKGRDPHLPYRFIDYRYITRATSNPLTRRGWQINKEYEIKDLDLILKSPYNNE